MANLDQAEANRLLNGSLGAASYTEPTTPMKLALVTSTGTATSPGTEVAGGSYARQTVTLGSASAGATSNTNAVEFAGLPECTVDGFEVWDSAGSPRRVWWAPLPEPRDFEAGDSARFGIGELDVTLT